MKTLYLIDFDGTLTRKDSFLCFLKVNFKGQYYWGFFLFLPILLMMKLKVFGMNEEKAKKKLLAYFLGGKTQTEIQEMAVSFQENHLYSDLMRPEALVFIKEITQNPTNTVYLVSASVDIWLEPIAKELNMKLICTQAAYESNVFKGAFSSPNCNGEEKKRRILAIVDIDAFDEVISLGDTAGDRAMFTLATEKIFKPFR